MARPDEFSELLTTAVHRIKSCESNKSIRIVQDELGYALGREGESAIYHWRRGNIPQIEDVEALAREIIRRSDLGQEWLIRFLKSAGHSYPEGIGNELFPGNALVEPRASSIEPPSTEPPTNQPSVLVPRKSYRALIGRDEQVRRAVTSLSDSDGPWAVAIDGIGGVGKTALAHEIVAVCVKRGLFSTVIWLSAARNVIFTATQHREDNQAGAITFESLLNTVGVRFGISNIGELSLSEKESRIQALFHRQRVLLVLDNLDTATEPQYTIASRLQPLVGQSRAILTSRCRFIGDFYAIHLDGLSESSAQQFIHQEANYRGVHRVAAVDERDLRSIILLTGGSPLAMKLVVGHLTYLPVSAVLQHLKDVKPLSPDIDEDEYIRLYQSIYLPAWALLSEEGKKLLIAMTLFVPTIGGIIRDIAAVSGLVDEERTLQAIHELWQLSLIDIDESSDLGLEHVRYYSHVLTHYFVVAEICSSPGSVASSADYSALFEDNIVRSLRAIGGYIQSDPAILPSEEHRNWALHVLTYAFKQPRVWPNSCHLLLALAPKMELAGERDDWIPYLEQGIRQSKSCADLKAEAELRLHLGYLYQLTGKFAEAETHLKLSAELFEALNEVYGYARTLNRLAYVARLQRQYEEAHELIEKVLPLLNEENPERADSHFVLGIIAFDKRDWPSAAQHFQRSLELWEKLGDKRRIAWGLRNLGPTLRAQGRYDQAIECYTEAIALLEEVHDSAQQAVTRMNLGVVYLTLEKPQQALELFMIAEPILEQVCDTLHRAMNHCNMGIAYRTLKQWKDAENSFLFSIEQWKQIGNVEAVVNVLDELGLVYWDQGLSRKAAAIFRDALERLVCIKDEPGYQYQLEVIQEHLKEATQTSS